MKYENTKTLITGGTGFLGHHLARALLDRGAEVCLLIQSHEKKWRLGNLPPGFEIVEADLTNREATKAVIREAKPEVIVHFAGWMERRRDLSILEEMARHHVEGTMNLILSSDPKVTKIVINTGTSEEYGEQDDPFLEDRATDPVSPYSATKAATSAMAIYLSKALGIPIITMRPFITYGPGQIHDTLIPFLIRGVLQKKVVELTDGLQFRDFIFVDDLISCYLAVIEKAESFRSPQIFNVGTGRKARVRDVIETIADLMNGREYLKIGAKPMRPGEPQSMMADIRKAKEVLGWSPRVPLREGLKKTIAWWLQHDELWRT